MPIGGCAGARRILGEIEIEALSDGDLHAPPEVIFGIDSTVVESKLDRSSGRLTIPVNVFLLRLAGRLVLVDAGAGSLGGADAGRLGAELVRRGIQPGAIDFVLMTHLHPDHVGGLIGPDGRPSFPRAQIVVHPNELTFWLERNPDIAMSERLRRNMAHARRALQPYAEHIVRCETLSLPGVTPIELFGHTPGHVGWLVEGGGARLLLWGDIVHFAELQTAFPQAGLVYDVDEYAAAECRQAVFDLVMREALEVGGAHLPFPGFGRLLRVGEEIRLLNASASFWNSTRTGDDDETGHRMG